MLGGEIQRYPQAPCSLQLLIKSVRCRQSVGSGTLPLPLLQFRNFAVRLIRCSVP
jgi:hypothetical protein